MKLIDHVKHADGVYIEIACDAISDIDSIGDFLEGFYGHAVNIVEGSVAYVSGNGGATYQMDSSGTWKAINFSGGGGGGEGGTTDYNDLTNKPRINSVTLSGNKSLGDIGVSQAISDALTPVETAIAGKVDKVSGKGLSTNDFTNADKADLSTALSKANAAAPQSTTYNKTEVDTAISTETSARESADSALQSSIDSKASVNEILGVGTAIPENSDLNTYTTIGVYSCGATNAATLANCPITVGFRLEVVRLFANTRRQQRLWPQDPNNGTFYIRTEGANGFGTWFKFEGGAVS